jgi:hypothetical protein
MGTPVKIREREEQCKGAGECSPPRPMTEEEMLKYYTKEEIEEMSSKITPPEKEKLIEVLGEKKGRTNAIKHASKTFEVSAPLIYAWIKDYDVKFDNSGLVIQELEEVFALKVGIPEVEVNTLDNITEYEETLQPAIDEERYSEEPDCEEELKDTIKITGQETTEIACKIGYVEYEVGKSVVIVDFRAELVSINGMELPQKEADAIADLLINIL